MADGRGSCCVARYDGGAVYDSTSKIDRILLSFRPIAPKPASRGGAVSGGSSVESKAVQVRSSTGQGKRRHNGGGNGSNKKSGDRKRKVSSESSSGWSVSGGETAVTLPLLPETPDRKDSPARGSTSDHSDLTGTEKQEENLPISLNLIDNVTYNRVPSGTDGRVLAGLDQTAVMVHVGSIVTVECVTDTWGEGCYGLGYTDEERMRSLEWDTCPGLISDGFNRVLWANGAYREMAGDDGDGEVVVRLVMTESVLAKMCAAFTITCRVKLVQYACGKEKSSLTVPCDVWKMDGGGFAWRLDVKAALCLGR